MAAPAFSLALKISAHPVSGWPRLAGQWSDLAESARTSSIFLSQAWIETWIEMFGAAVRPSLLTFEHGGRPVGAALVAEDQRRIALAPVLRLSLNAAEEAGGHSFLESNGLLCRPGWENGVADSVASHLLGRRWDELSLEGFAPGPAYERMKHVLRAFDLEERFRSSHYVDLAALRASGVTYESTLGATIRTQIRSRLEGYAEAGPIRVERAADVETALSMLTELVGLNCLQWAGLGARGVAISPSFMGFHRRLIRRSFEGGAVQMLRVMAASETIGLVYSLVHRGKVCFRQSWHHLAAGRRPAPNTVVLARVIEHCLEAGFDQFEFPAGEERYKQNLATGTRRLVWAVFRRPSVKMRALRRIERCLSKNGNGAVALD